MKRVINNNKQLHEFLETISESEFVAIDTEFVREKTFFPQLCLIQIADANHHAAIDPFAKDCDLNILFDFLFDTKRLKIFHSGRQDCEIFYHLCGNVPTPIFDTQIAAMVLGLGEQVSYQRLVEKYTHVKLDKSLRFQDWVLRPLPANTIDYALNDVIYLAQIYPIMANQLTKENKLEWINEELSELSNLDNYNIDPKTAYLRGKMLPNNDVKRAQYQQLMQLREELAIKRNIPRGFILKDEQIADIIAQQPRSCENLANLRGIGKGLAFGKDGQFIVDIITNAKAEQAPPMPQICVLPTVDENLLEMLKLLLKIKSRSYNIVPRIIASNDDLIFIAAGKPPSSMMRGWRYEVFGQFAEEFIGGKINLSVKVAKDTIKNPYHLLLLEHKDE